MSRKHDLKVLSVDRSTPSSVVVSLEKMESHTYDSGQYLTLELTINGEQVNRSYSFCSAPHEEKWQIGVKHVPNGKASTYLNQSLKSGDVLTCLEPMGNFTLDGIDSSETHFQFFAAGSGVTPIYSMLKSLLKEGNAGKITLYYGNKTPEETMFLSELTHLEDQHHNFNLELIYSQSGGQDALHSGRMNFGKTLELLRLHANDRFNPQAFICGPGDMIKSIKNALLDNNYAESQVHAEYFTAPSEISEAVSEEPMDETEFTGVSQIKVVLDDEDHTISLATDGEVILDAALNAGLDAPFSCKGGVCTACRAKVTKGKVHMNSNFALTDAEIEEGYILTCQAHPRSSELVVDFDD